MHPLPTSLWMALLTLASSAQTIEVPGDYADLQVAIDAAPENATIVVHGGHWFALTLTKPVRLVGDPRPYIWGDGDGVLEPPISLAGAGSGAVVLENLDVGVEISAGGFDVNAPAITGQGFDRLVVRDSVVSGPRWSLVYNYVFPGATAIEVDLPLVWIERSVIAGSDTEAAENNLHHASSNPTPLGAPGGSGIVTTGHVVLFDSRVLAGSGDPLIPYASADCSFPCPGGNGGNGVVCQLLVNAASTIEAGEPSAWYDETGQSLCCAGSPGRRTIVQQEWTVDVDAWVQLRTALALLD